MKRCSSDMERFACILEWVGFAGVAVILAALLATAACTSDAARRVTSTLTIEVGESEGAVGPRESDGTWVAASVRPLAALEPPTVVRIDPPPIVQPELSWALVPRADPPVPGGAAGSKGAGTEEADVEPSTPSGLPWEAYAGAIVAVVTGILGWWQRERLVAAGKSLIGPQGGATA